MNQEQMYKESTQGSSYPESTQGSYPESNTEQSSYPESSQSSYPESNTEQSINQGYPESTNECIYKSKNQRIELHSESLNTEIKMSQIIQNKMVDSKSESNFSYIINTEIINISQITEDEFSICNLSREEDSKYLLCEYTNRPSLTINEFLNKKTLEVDSKTMIRFILDFHITLQGAVIELYKITKIVNNSINVNNIIISEEQIPIIKNFKNATIEEIELSKYIDIKALANSFLSIINSLSIMDNGDIINKYKESLNRIINSEPNENSVFKIEELQ
jgi:hypothetical protein